MNMTRADSSALRASFLCIVVNLFLATVKLIAGLVCAAPTLISDAIHSASDLISTAVVAIGIRLSGKEADQTHPYGHGRIESLSAIILAGILLFAGIGIAEGGLESILSGSYRNASPPSAVALLVALLSILLKLFVARHLIRTSARASSSALRADGFHQLSDALATLAALIGIALSMLGLRIFDPLASIAISLFLFRTAYGVFCEASMGLTDHSISPEEERSLRAIAEGVEGLSVASIRPRLFGSGIYLEIALEIDRSRTVGSYEEPVRLLLERINASDTRVLGCTVIFFPARP